MGKSTSASDRLQTIFNLTTSRPVAITMVAIAVLVFGFVSYKQLSLNLMPDISYPTLTVRTEYPGAAPEEVETTVSRPLEQALGVVGNLVDITTISRAGVSDAVLEFTWDTEMNMAIQDIREKLDQVILPDGVERPLILRYDPSLDPILRIGLHGGEDLFELRKIAEDEIKRGLETVPGVAAVKVKGGLEREIRIELDEQKLAVLGLNIRDINNIVSQENINLAGGNLKEGQTEYLVRTLNEFATVGEIADLVIERKQGVEIRIRDIGSVLETHKDREVITRIRGGESVEIEIYKEADANIVAVAERVKNRVYGNPAQQAFVRRMKAAEEQRKAAKEEKAAAEAKKKEEEPSEKKKEEKGKGKGESKGQGDGMDPMIRKMMTDFLAYDLPDGVGLVTLSDQSTFIKNAVDEVKNTAVIGAFLAVIVLFVFLRKITTTLIIAVAIPLSIISTFAPMHIFNVSLNIMSLGGLALGVGMLVDNSIVVLESIFRCREEGDDIIRSAVRGVKEVGTAVFASTLTTIAVFFPIVFVQGVAGQIFGDLSLTVVFSLAASVAVALFLIPMLASRRLRFEKSGLSLEKLRSMSFIHLKSVELLKSLVAENGNSTAITSLIRRAGMFVWYVIRLVAEAIVKLTLLIFVALLVLLKMLFILISTLLSPLTWLVALPLKKLRGINSALRGWSEYDGFMRLTFSRSIWDGLFVYIQPNALVVGLNGFFVRYRREAGSSIGKIKTALKWTGLSISAPFVVVYFTFRFIFSLVAGFLGHISIIVLMFLTLFLISLWSLAGIMLMPIALPVVSLFERGFNALLQIYPKIVRWALRNKGAVVGISATLVFLGWYVLIPLLGTELIPEVHQGEFSAEVYMPVGTRLEETDKKVLAVENRIRGNEMIAELATVVGAEKTANLESDEGEHTGRVTVRMKPNFISFENEDRLVEEVRASISDIPGIETKISRPALFSFKTPVEVEVEGYDLTTLRKLAAEVELKLSKLDGLKDVKSYVQSGNPEVQIYYDRKKLARHGLNIYNVASLVRNKVKGEVATRFKEEDKRIDVLVKLKEEDRESIGDLRRIVVNPGEPIPVYLDAIADIRVGEGPGEIRRIDQQRVALITANTSGIDLGSAMTSIAGALDRMDWPVGFSYSLGGQNEEMKTSIDSLFFALLLAVFLVYVVMASQFESFIHPLVIMFTIPLAFIGVVVVLWAMAIPLSVVVFLGMIMLAGIVVNNAIVLVDYINQLRARGMDKMEAIVTAGEVRLRPILMTTATTVLGLLPMALGFGEGAEIRTPMAITVIAGLISSTALTLVVIPTFYAIIDRSE